MSPVSLPSTISFRRVGLGLMALTASVALIACGDSDDDGGDGSASTPTPTATQAVEPTQAPEPTQTTEATATAEPTSDAPNEVDTAACEGVSQLVAAAFPGATLIEDTTAFELAGDVSDGCRVMVRGTAAELPTFLEVQDTLREAMESDGWVENIQYQADGPTGTATVYEKDGEMALVISGISPEDPDACPADQIIGECLERLEPEELIVQGEVVVKVD